MKQIILLLTLATLTFGYGQKKKHKTVTPPPTAVKSPVNIISIKIERTKDEVYQFASNPENFPQWLGFVKSIKKISGDSWKAETTMGSVTIDLFPENKLGVIDHNVTLPDKTVVHNSLRVMENGTGSKVVFVLFEMPGKTEADYKKDTDSVRADLNKLKKIMESDAIKIASE